MGTCPPCPRVTRLCTSASLGKKVSRRKLELNLECNGPPNKAFCPEASLLCTASFWRETGHHLRKRPPYRQLLCYLCLQVSRSWLPSPCSAQGSRRWLHISASIWIGPTSCAWCPATSTWRQRCCLSSSVPEASWITDSKRTMTTSMTCSLHLEHTLHLEMTRFDFHAIFAG